MSKQDLLRSTKKLLARKYKCEGCGQIFDFVPVISNIPKPTIMIDPAPSLTSLFKRPSCPQCGSKNLKKIN